MHSNLPDDVERTCAESDKWNSSKKAEAHAVIISTAELQSSQEPRAPEGERNGRIIKGSLQLSYHKDT